MDKDNGWLNDMRLYAEKALDLTAGFDRDAFMADTRTHLAIIHTLVIVGEAAAQVSESVRTQLHTIPWGVIVGMRNKLVHHYFKADLDVVWKTVADDLQPMIDAIDVFLQANSAPPVP